MCIRPSLSSEAERFVQKCVAQYKDIVTVEKWVHCRQRIRRDWNKVVVDLQDLSDPVEEQVVSQLRRELTDFDEELASEYEKLLRERLQHCRDSYENTLAQQVAAECRKYYESQTLPVLQSGQCLSLKQWKVIHSRVRREAFEIHNRKLMPYPRISEFRQEMDSHWTRLLAKYQIEVTARRQPNDFVAMETKGGDRHGIINQGIRQRESTEHFWGNLKGL